MRFKEIPQEIAHVFDNKYVLYGTVAVVAIGGYLLFKKPSSTSPVTASSADTSAYTGTGGYPYTSYGYSDPTAFSAISSSSGNVTNSSSNDALIALEAQTEADSFAISMANVKNNADLAVMNNNVALAGIAASNYNTTAGIYSAFLSSGSSLLIGGINLDPATGSATVNLASLVPTDKVSLRDFVNDKNGAFGKLTTAFQSSPSAQSGGTTLPALGGETATPVAASMGGAQFAGASSFASSNIA